jgi:hypothetical protein
MIATRLVSGDAEYNADIAFTDADGAFLISSDALPVRVVPDDPTGRWTFDPPAAAVGEADAEVLFVARTGGRRLRARAVSVDAGTPLVAVPVSIQAFACGMSARPPMEGGRIDTVCPDCPFKVWMGGPPSVFARTFRELAPEDCDEEQLFELTLGAVLEVPPHRSPRGTGRRPAPRDEPRRPRPLHRRRRLHTVRGAVAGRARGRDRATAEPGRPVADPRGEGRRGSRRSHRRDG